MKRLICWLFGCVPEESWLDRYMEDMDVAGHIETNTASDAGGGYEFR